MKTHNYEVAPSRTPLSAKPTSPTEPINSFGPSSSVFDTVAENRFTYGKAKPNEWDFQGKAPTLKPSKAERKDQRERGSHVFRFTPKSERPSYPAAKQNGDRVAVSQGDKVTKRFRVDKVDPVTKEETSFLVKFTVNTISVLSYGQLFQFTMSNRAKGTFGDSRDGKRHPIGFAKSELVRILGVTEGMSKFLELTTFINPAALSPSEAETVELLVGSLGMTEPKARKEVLKGRKAELPQGSKATVKQFDEQGIRIA